MSVGALGHHDLGGDVAVAAIPIDTTEKDYTHWELMTHGGFVELVARGQMSVDELRRGVEALEKGVYDSASYYERWAAAVATILIERGTITREELEKELEGTDAACEPHPFVPGDRVIVKPEDAVRHWRKPHLRIPGYLHGAAGEIVSVCGKFEDPSYAAFRELNRRWATHVTPTGAPDPDVGPSLQSNAHHQYLYVVRFHLHDLMVRLPFDEGCAETTVTADVFHPWLRRASGKDAVAEQAEHSAADHTHDSSAHHAHSHAHEEGEAPHEHHTRFETECRAVEKEAPEKPLQPLAIALWRLLDAKQIVPTAAITRRIEILRGRTKELTGARLIARAWVDTGFKERLMKDSAAAASELGIATSNYTASVSLHPDQPKEHVEHRLGTTLLKVVVENTPEVHHLVVCTLCSCYPGGVLGMAPEWYKSRNYRAQAVLRPRTMLKESFGLDLPASQRIEVHDSTAELRWLVLPMRPAGTEGWSEEQLLPLISRDSMIGVARALPPPPAISN